MSSVKNSETYVKLGAYIVTSFRHNCVALRFWLIVSEKPDGGISHLELLSWWKLEVFMCFPEAYPYIHTN